MQSSVFLLTIVLSVGSSMVFAEDHTHHTDDFATIRKEAVDKCSKEHNINEGAIKDILNHIQVAQDEEVKLKEKTIDWARLEDVLNSAAMNEKDKVHQLVETCRSQVDQDNKNECQVAYSLAVCKIKQWNLLDLPKGNWE